MTLSSGEITVTVRGNGRGGCSAESLFSLTTEPKGESSIWVLAGDTDGIDSSEGNAGALMTSHSRTRGEKAGLEICDKLDDNNGYGYFQTFGDLLVIGPTRANMNDLRAILTLEP